MEKSQGLETGNGTLCHINISMNIHYNMLRNQLHVVSDRQSGDLRLQSSKVVAIFMQSLIETNVLPVNAKNRFNEPLNFYFELTSKL